MADKKQHRTLGVDAAREIVTGSLAGAVSKVFEFPMDSVKVRMQYSQSLPVPLFNSTWECIAKSYQQDGLIRGFYRGLVPPMIGAAAEISTLFFSYNMAQDAIKLWRGSQLTEDLGLADKLVCGAWSGICTSFVLTPAELFKCRFQVESFRGRRTTVPQIIRSVVKQHGFKGLWKGELTTLVRESGGSMAWFGNYEAVLKYFAHGDPHHEPKAWQLMLAGSVAGVGYHCLMFPVDTVKSIYQIDEGGQRTLGEISKNIYMRSGLKGFYSGLGITLCKSIPASALLFLTYETIKKNLPF